MGTGTARLSRGDMRRLGLRRNDVVELCGKHTTVALVRPAGAREMRRGTIRIDGIIRGNGGVGLDDKVAVRKVTAQAARAVTLQPETASKAVRSGHYNRYVAHLLHGMPVVARDRVRVKLFGTRPLEFTVASTDPPGPVFVSKQTALEVQRTGPGRDDSRQVGISYEDIGGLHKEVARIREMVELPLRYPEVFERLGIEAPRGVLLYGPPGCGKTYLAKAVAHETEAHFIHINGPEVMHRFYGESEAHLRTIFEEATREAPSIIFIDEIDAIAPKREEVHGEVEKRVVAQLLALMDGLRSRGQVIVIGATNIPNAVDPALRRPGRFDRELAFSIPDKRGRLEILRVHTRGMPLAAEVDLERLAALTHGFVGADLEALCREAAMSTFRRLMPEIDFTADYIPYEKLLKLEVTQERFLEALKEVEPSAIREVFTEVPEVRWSDVGGLHAVKRLLQETVEWPLEHLALFEYAQVSPRKGILLTGEPGTGKTLVAKALARESEVNFISVKGPELLSKWVGESERGVREVFKKARQAAPCIVFFDEIDALAPRRTGGATDSHVSDRVLSQFLAELDGIEELRGMVVLGATNRPDMVDRALLRPGRFDLVVRLPLPDEAARREILRIHTGGKPLAGDVYLEGLVKETEGWAGSDLEGVCREATMLAIRAFLERTGEGPPDYGSFVITGEHFRQALEDTLAYRGRSVPAEPA